MSEPLLVQLMIRCSTCGTRALVGEPVSLPERVDERDGVQLVHTTEHLQMSLRKLYMAGCTCWMQDMQEQLAWLRDERPEPAVMRALEDALMRSRGA